MAVIFFSMLIGPIKGAASVYSEAFIDENNVIYNTPGIPNEKDWEAYLKEQARLETLTRAKKTVKTASFGFDPCSCVSYAQFKGLGISGYGNAKNYPVNSAVPSNSGFVVTYESGRGHIAKYVRDGIYLILDESNYSPCKVTQGRKLLIGSSKIKGYIN